MAGHHHHHHHRRLMLSGLKTNTGYYLSNNVSPRRCLINVKLTDFCMRSVESLMDSDKVKTLSSPFYADNSDSCVSNRVLSFPCGLMKMEE